jgi:MFS family permease
VLASLGQAVAGNWAGFLALRFLAGVVGSPPISIFGGVIADLFEGEVVRGRVMMYWYVCVYPCFVLSFFLFVSILTHLKNVLFFLPLNVDRNCTDKPVS